MKTLYTAHATATGRDGQAKTDDGFLNLQLSPPGSGKKGTNPEQLFACGYAACFASACEHVAKKEKIAISSIEVKADVSLNQDEASGYSLSVTLDVSLPGVDKANAEKIVKYAHENVCPYSKATRGNIEVTLKANQQPLAQAA